MAWQCSGASNAELVANMVRTRVIQRPEVAALMRRVDRAKYCPRDAASQRRAYADSPMSIGYGATISAPHMHAMCLDLLLPHLKPGSRALDVGSGSGYLLACMAHAVGPTGRVFGIEHVPELVAFSESNLRDDASDDVRDRITVVQGDGRLGLAAHAPFDCIHVGAAADGVPEALLQQLREPTSGDGGGGGGGNGGCLVIPVGAANGDQVLKCIHRVAHAPYFVERIVTGVRYIPLTHLHTQLQDDDAD